MSNRRLADVSIRVWWSILRTMILPHFHVVSGARTYAHDEWAAFQNQGSDLLQGAPITGQLRSIRYCDWLRHKASNFASTRPTVSAFITNLADAVISVDNPNILESPVDT